MKRDPNCTRCRLHQTAQHVCLLGQGARRADVMIIGEAPGHREDDSGRPFVGRAGQLLREILGDNGFSDGNIFITNAVSCRPPDNRTPTKREIQACRHWLDYQIQSVKPKYLLLLGNVPLQSVLGVTGIKKLRGKPVEHEGMVVVPTYHPAFILRDPTQRETLEADIRLLREIVDYGGIPQEEGLNKREVLDLETFEEMLEDLAGTVSFDIETTGLYPWSKSIKTKYYDRALITAVGFGTANYQWTIPFHHYEVHPFNDRQLRKIVKRIDRRLRDCVIVAQNGKFDSLWMKVHYGVTWPIDFDTQLAHYMIDENQRHGLKLLSQIYLGAVDYAIDPIDTPWDQLSHYHCLDLLYTRKLRFIFGRLLRKEPNVRRVFQEIIMPLSAWYLDAEFNGVYVDTSKFEQAEAYLVGEIAEAKRVLDEYGPDINWRSPKQLVQLLFQDLGIKPLDRTKKGAFSTSESVLKRINHPIGPAILRYRGAAQQLSFFIEGWKPFLDDHSYLHPSFKIHGTVTGRASCEHPNLQQVPRDPRIRSLITAPDGWELVEADLSQIELRIAAELSGEKNMLEVFRNGEDIHWKTAVKEISRGGGLVDLVRSTARAHVGKPVPYEVAIRELDKIGHRRAIEIDDAWKEHRKKAKAVNFGYLYGMGWRKFMQYARDNYGMVVTDQQAQASRDAFFSSYPGLVEWHRRQRNFARRNGYVTTLTGRKRRLSAAMSPYDSPERGEAERQAINSPVQGFACELNFMAALQIAEEFDQDTVQCVGTVHDAVLFRVRTEKVEKVVPRVLEIMSCPKLLDELNIKIRVPIEAEATIGPWSQGKELKEWVSSR